MGSGLFSWHPFRPEAYGWDPLQAEPPGKPAFSIDIDARTRESRGHSQALPVV
jgi:hypothetical protein